MFNGLSESGRRWWAGGAAAGAVVLAVVVLAWWSRGPARTPIPHDLFYDEASGTFVELPPGEIPPAGPEGAETLVRAVLRQELAGGGPRVGTGSVKLDDVAYLFRFTPAARTQFLEAVKGAQGSPLTTAIMARQDGKEVRRPTPSARWVAVASPEGQAIISGN